MTIDELCRKAANAWCQPFDLDHEASELHKRDCLAREIKQVIGPELAARDAEIERLRSQLGSAWAVIKRQHDAGLRDKPEVSMERADLDAAIAGVCASRDAEIWRLLHGWQANAARCDDLIAEIERLQRENAELRATIDMARRDMNTMRSDLQAERDRLFAENAELRKDAGRWRKARKFATHHGAPSTRAPQQAGYWWEILVPYLPSKHKTIEDAIDSLPL